MALFSDIDWVIVVAVAAFLLLGKGNGALLRQLGRYYGKAVTLKQEMLNEVTRVAEVPPIDPTKPFSIREVLIGGEATTRFPAAIPAAVAVAPAPPREVVAYPALTFSVAALGYGNWSVAHPAEPLASGGPR